MGSNQEFYKGPCAALASGRTSSITWGPAQRPKTGRDYLDDMSGMLAVFPGMTVTLLDGAGRGDMFHIAWETSSLIHGQQGKFLGVDRFRIVDAMAVEEHIIFGAAVLQPEGRSGIDD